MDKSYAKYLIHNAKDENLDLKPEDFLRYTNDLWHFSLSLNSLAKLKIASNKLDEKLINVNYIYASLWAGQKEYFLTKDYKIKHKELLDWHQNQTMAIRNQRLALEKNQKEPKYFSSRKSFSLINENLIKAEYIMEQHEQALLHTYIINEIGFTKSENADATYASRLKCLQSNFTLALEDVKITQDQVPFIADFFSVILDEADALELSQNLIS